MDNIIIEETDIREEDDLATICIIITTEKITFKETYYIGISSYIEELQLCKKQIENGLSFYIETGPKADDYVESFSMEFLFKDSLGHINIEMDLRVAEYAKVNHRCIFYVKSELGQVLEFLDSFIRLLEGKTNKISLISV